LRDRGGKTYNVFPLCSNRAESGVGGKEEKTLKESQADRHYRTVKDPGGKVHLSTPLGAVSPGFRITRTGEVRSREKGDCRGKEKPAGGTREKKVGVAVTGALPRSDLEGKGGGGGERHAP